MDAQKRQAAIKILIIVLAVLFVISAAALAGILIYKHFAPAGQSSVVVPDNIIAPEEDVSVETLNILNGTHGDSAVESQPSKETEEGIESRPPKETEKSVEETESTTQPTVSASQSKKTEKTATALYLYKRNSGDNTPFHAANMFPGDVQTQYFCVQVAYRDDVTVKYHADIRPGYEKLSEVLKCRITLLTTNEILYDGLMQSMPESLNHALYTSGETTTKLYYEITAYLDTSVGNEYQNKELMADFRWWVEEEGHLANNPQTGDDSNLTLLLGLMIGSLFMLILLFTTRKKEEQQYG